MKKITAVISLCILCNLANAQMSFNAVFGVNPSLCNSIWQASKFWLTQSNYLVTHKEIRQKVSEGYFEALDLSAIPDDDKCISAENAKLWLSIDASKLPANGRLPMWQELVPVSLCTGPYKRMVNGICETAIFRCIETYWVTGDIWNNHYAWVWPDNTFFEDFWLEEIGACW
ncbi:hypothetical protein [Chitinophaga sp. CB10]|uniref:hypothetical protein n=1 Tax=Chitinophaga sp. CB10 TaxID=1891659 RepID=UPI0025B9A3B8|nr:hypothetical protein [Chitinophaga sp. CB10]